MSRLPAALSLTGCLMAGMAHADVPNVAVDIAPVHSLVAQVMGDVGTPDLILPPGASPHEYSLRPSEAAAMQNADIIFWIGADLTPWMEGALDNLAPDTTRVTLLDASETTLLEFRENALFEAHDDDGHDDHGHEEAVHDDDAHDDHGHDEAKHDDAAHDDHDDHAEDDHAGHDHGAHDPHAWLSPDNAAQWLDLIAARLSSADPANAGTYFANAAAAKLNLTDLKAQVDTTLAPVRGGSFVAFHDAYQYFEAAFDMPASGAIALSDATDPSPARVAQIQDRVRDQNIACVLAEPQFNPGIVATVIDGTASNTGVIDPLGAALTPGPDLYGQLIANMAQTLADCL